MLASFIILVLFCCCAWCLLLWTPLLASCCVWFTFLWNLWFHCDRSTKKEPNKSQQWETHKMIISFLIPCPYDDLPVVVPKVLIAEALTTPTNIASAGKVTQASLWLVLFWSFSWLAEKCTPVPWLVRAWIISANHWAHRTLNEHKLSGQTTALR